MEVSHPVALSRENTKPQVLSVLRRAPPGRFRTFPKTKCVGRLQGGEEAVLLSPTRPPPLPRLALSDTTRGPHHPVLNPSALGHPQPPQPDYNPYRRRLLLYAGSRKWGGSSLSPTSPRRGRRMSSASSSVTTGSVLLPSCSSGLVPHSSQYLRHPFALPPSTPPSSVL